jgi:trimethylamine--corrinoid protein Co-methyltransferase
MIKFVVAGIPVSDETLAADVIASVGPFGDFLSEDHTMAHMREQSQPGVIDRRVREEWAAQGSSTAHERATAKAREILDTHQPMPVAEGAREEMRAIIAEAEEHLGVAATVERV